MVNYFELYIVPSVQTEKKKDEVWTLGFTVIATFGKLITECLGLSLVLSLFPVKSLSIMGLMELG